MISHTFKLVNKREREKDKQQNKYFRTLFDLVIFLHLHKGDTHSIVGATNGKLYCWGWDDYG